MNQPVKWVAELSGVQEISILGIADLGFWKQRLRRSGLIPAERDGHAQIMIIAASATFAGIKFRELSFSVLAANPSGAIGRDSAYLEHAFNSCRFFALCERVFYSTPYRHADVRLAGTFPASIELVAQGRIAFQARMQVTTPAGSRAPSSRGDDGWQGAVFLPEPNDRRPPRWNLFFARIHGFTERYPFLPSHDYLTIQPISGPPPVLQALLDSSFLATEWLCREKATHSKSKTYSANELVNLAAPAHPGPARD